MAWNFFKSDTDNEKEISLEQKIDLALKKAETDRRKAETDINKVRGWAQDAIIEVYSEFFPNAHLSYYRDKYKKDALEKYAQIKEEHASKLPKDKVAECDQIVNGYLNQIALRESKMKLYEKLTREYSSMKNKMKNIENEQVKGDNLQAHKNRLQQLDNDTSLLSESYTDNYKLDDLREEVEFKAEYFNQLEALDQQYSDESNFENATAFKDEIDKMLEKL